MPRPPRLQFDGGFYHVYSRGNRRHRIFWTATDYREFEDRLLDAAVRNNVSIYQWRLMPNHFHILLQTPNGNLAVFMQRFLVGYARYFNRIHKQVGHLFQSRYGARLCDKEEYLMELVRYIALNAHRAKNWEELVKRGEAEWSSHRYYLNGDEPGAVRPFIHEVLRRFGDDLPTSRLRYAQFIADGLSDPNALRSLPQTVRFLGSDRFIEESKIKGIQPVRQIVRNGGITPERLIQVAWDQFFITEAQLRSSQDRRVSAVRRAWVYVAKRYGWITTTTIAHRLGCTVSAVSQMCHRQEARPEDPIVQGLFQGIEKLVDKSP